MNFTDEFLRAMGECKNLNLNAVSHVAALVIISRDDRGAILANIARSLKISPAAMTGLADTLIRMGLAKRAHEENLDRRAIRLAITSAGRDAIQIILTPKKQTHEPTK